MKINPKHLLRTKLYLEYYKKNITDKYSIILDNIVLDNDCLSLNNEKLFVTTFDKYEKIQQENKQLKEIIKENTILVKDEYGNYQECNINPLEMKQKYDKQVDNWNKLKEWLYEDHYLYVPEIAINSTYQVVLNKMLELQRGENDG